MKQYWRSIEEAQPGFVPEKDEFKVSDKNEFFELLEGNANGSQASRRDFLKLLGFSVTSAALAASCERPVEKAIPFLIAPADITPGKANYYASAIFDGTEFASVVVKVRDGRPIKLEGNTLDPLAQGGTTSRIQASILGLYDNARYVSPQIAGKPVSWADADAALAKALIECVRMGRKIVLLTTTIISPSARLVLEKFRQRFEGFEVVTYDVASASAALEASQITTGRAILPGINLYKARVVVSVQADFLGTWLMPATFASQYSASRKLNPSDPRMLKHIQFESGMSLTGANADKRVPIRPSEELAVVAALYNALAKLKGYQQPYNVEVKSTWDIDAIAAELASAGSAGILLCGSDQPEVQKIAIAINYILGNEGTTIDSSREILIRQGDDKKVLDLISDMESEKVGIIFLNGVNPAYDFPDSKRIVQALKKVPFSVSFASARQETAELCSIICPDSHPLERWGDFEPVTGHLYLAQPCIQNIFDTRQWEESLLTWSGNSPDFYTLLKANWEESLSDTFVCESHIADQWPQWLQRGYMAGKPGAISKDFRMPAPVEIASSSEGIEVCIDFTSIGIGTYANNPWLQELPDPITKVTWGNVAAVSPGLAAQLSIVTGDIVKIDSLELPAYVQPGQAEGTLSIALGYGRTLCGKAGEKVGVNAYPLIRTTEGRLVRWVTVGQVTKTGEKVALALTQTHDSMEGRPIIRETTLPRYRQHQDAGNELHEEFEKKHLTLYPDQKYDGFHWGLAVDLNACTGCSACMIACQVENNIPVVGPEQVSKRRSMHWVRVDRYFSGPPEDPAVLFQPVMCQHCDNAPCENVCPVSATNHSNEGLNQMAYNRCIGTKYCINNCPYRVRRFNWFKYVNNSAFDYNQNSALERLVLNPDVVVRERGVVEKCSFCVQRIQEAKLNAKLDNRPIRDGEIQPACVQACPSKALVFGNLNDSESEVSKAFANKRNYHLLEELHTLPSVGYLTKVRNTDTEKI